MAVRSTDIGWGVWLGAKNYRNMKIKKQHWTVITHNEWPAILMQGQDDPLIIFANNTVLGERAASRWAALIAEWMNEQMRLKGTTAPRHAAQLRARLRKTENELRKLNLENQDLHSRLMHELERGRVLRGILESPRPSSPNQ